MGQEGGITERYRTINGPRANGPNAVTGDPSGLPVAVGGAQVLTVAMSPAIATYAASLPPGPLYSGPTSFMPPDTANVVLTGDFESVLTWAIGFRSAATPRVSVLTAPTRVVVDIRHTAAPAQPATGAPASPAETPTDRPARGGYGQQREMPGPQAERATTGEHHGVTAGGVSDVPRRAIAVVGALVLIASLRSNDRGSRPSSTASASAARSTARQISMLRLDS
jgi:hypothetical protein